MERLYELNREYLLIPICAEKEVKKLEFFHGEQKILELRVPCGELVNGEYVLDYYAQIPKHLLRETMRICGEFPESFFEKIGESDCMESSEEHRPKIHFTAQTGWINDPNGLVYHDGEYHLYFQYNPFNTQWENMSWGHAVSKDLLHWEQLDTVLLPDETGTMFSGCGMVNERGDALLPKDALLFFYTSAGSANDWSEGSPFVQYLAYSTDQGRTLKKSFVKALDTVKQENRDPKVFWYEKDQCYYMVIWLEGNEFGIYRSDNLIDFEETQRFVLDKSWECPDLFFLSVAGSKEQKWVFWAADGFYYTCDFEHGKLSNFSEQKEAYQNKVPYAAQTISGVHDRVISIPWLRMKFDNRFYTGAMGLPRELSLVEKNGTFVLVQMPVREYEEEKRLVFEASLSGDTQYGFDQESHQEVFAGAFEFECQFKGESAAAVVVDGKTIAIEQPIDGLRVLVDDRIMEVMSCDGTYYLVEELDQAVESLKFHVDQGMNRVWLYKV